VVGFRSPLPLRERDRVRGKGTTASLFTLRRAINGTSRRGVVELPCRL
jgi:hypothetical protein